MSATWGITVLRTPFHIFGALNLNARNFEKQLELAQEKEACGAYGFLTQPVLSERALHNLQQARQVLHGKILGGIFPVVSYKNACFLKNEISGMDICDEIIALYQNKDQESAEELAVTISSRISKEITPSYRWSVFHDAFQTSPAHGADIETNTKIEKQRMAGSLVKHQTPRLKFFVLNFS